jgi:hypothetical protein
MITLARQRRIKQKQKQRLIVTLRLGKWSPDRIARYIDVTPKTLTKHYSRELDRAADLIEGAAIEVLLTNMGKMLEMAREGQLAAILKRDLNMGDRYPRLT